MAYKFHLFRFVGLVLITLLSAACATAPKNLESRRGSADPSLSLVPQDADGILVIGLQTRRHPPVHTMEFRSFDPSARRLIPESKGAKVIRLNSGGTIFEKDYSAKKNGVRYLVQRLPAGSYYMTTVFFSSTWQNMSKGSLGFEIKPGLVNYIGNVRLQVPFFVFQNVAITPIGRDNAFVEEILKKYKDVKSKIDHQNMSISELNCDMASGLQACY